MLLGVDEEKKQIACGLVDTIGIPKFHNKELLTRQKLIFFFKKKTFSGSYTFAKTLEYKAKQGLQSGKEVTVIPPAEYRDRFVNVLDGYFVACPGPLYLSLCVGEFSCSSSHTQTCL